jgi:hypothetical protein
MGTHGTLFFFHPMFRDPEPPGRQVDHLASLRHVCRLGAQIVLAMLAAEDGMNQDLIRRLHLPQVMPTMALLSTGLLAALLPQALGRTDKPIGGGRQTAFMAIFGLLPFEGFDALLQSVDQPFEDIHALLLRANGDDGLFEPFAQVSIRLVRLFVSDLYRDPRSLSNWLCCSMVILTRWGMELKSVCLLTSKQLNVARNSLKQILIYVPLVKALLTLSFPSVRYVWTTWLTTILKFSKLASDGWEYSLSKQRIAI